MKPTILATDDSTEILWLIQSYFGKNYNIVTKENGMEAFMWLQAGNIPDLILSDIQMPKMDGYEFIEELRRSGFFRDIPVIMISNLETSEARIKAFRLGADDYMMKPFNPVELELRVQSLLKRSAKTA